MTPPEDLPLETALPRARNCPALARRLVEELFGDTLTHRSLDDLKLVTSELVDNAYVHGRGQIRLRLGRLEDRVRIEVMDDGDGAAVRIRRSAGGLGGNGLRLVDQLCVAWGARDGRTHVWAELPVQSTQ